MAWETTVLLSYGFTLPSNPCDTFALKLNQPPHPFLAIIAAAQPSFSSNTTSNSIAALLTTSSSQAPLPMTQHNTPPALSFPHNTYFLRPHSRFSVKEPDYPSTPSTTTSPHTPTNQEQNTSNQTKKQQRQSPHFPGIPHALLSTLSLTLSNTRERTLLSTNPSSFHPLHLWSQLGPRNILAVTSLLHARLRMEHARLSTLALSGNDMPAGSETTTNSTEASNRNQRRRELVNVYLSSQCDVLAANIETLEAELLHTLTSTFPPSSTSPSVEDPILLTLPHAMNVLKKVDRETYTAFREALTEIYGTDDLDALRSAGCEEDIWVLWTGAITRMHSSGGQQHPESWLRRWTRFLHQQYNVPPSPPASSSTPQSTDSEDEETSQITTHILSLLSTLTQPSTSTRPQSHVFTCDLWQRAYVAACVRAVREETLCLQLNGGMMEKVWRSERGGKGEEEEENVAMAGEGGSVVVMFVGAS